MSHARYPLVFSSRAAAEEAARLLPRGRCLENLVGAAIAGGRLSGEPRGSEPAAVYLDSEGLVARAVRTRSPLTGRKAWRVLSVRPGPPRDPHDNNGQEE